MIEELIKNAEADIELLKQNDLKGDQFDKPRQVDFLFKSPTREKAEAIAGFLSDYNFGNTNITQNENQFEVLVLIQMPINQNIIQSVSGFMLLIGKIFNSTFDGWGSVIQK